MRPHKPTQVPHHQLYSQGLIHGCFDGRKVPHQLNNQWIGFSCSSLHFPITILCVRITLNKDLNQTIIRWPSSKGYNWYDPSVWNSQSQPHALRIALSRSRPQMGDPSNPYHQLDLHHGHLEKNPNKCNNKTQPDISSMHISWDGIFQSSQAKRLSARSKWYLILKRRCRGSKSMISSFPSIHITHIYWRWKPENQYHTEDKQWKLYSWQYKPHPSSQDVPNLTIKLNLIVLYQSQHRNHHM